VRGRILAIDDDPAVLRVLGRHLGGEHDFVARTDAREALAALAAGERFDVIFCDLMMPTMNGAEFHAELGKLDPELQARVVFLSGGAFSQGAEAFIAGKPLIEKPFEVEALRAAVRAALERAPGPPRSSAPRPA
jgi:CheY-like chemotaxis protein